MKHVSLRNGSLCRRACAPLFSSQSSGLGSGLPKRAVAQQHPSLARASVPASERLLGSLVLVPDIGSGQGKGRVGSGGHRDGLTELLYATEGYMGGRGYGVAPREPAVGVGWGVYAFPCFRVPIV